MSIIIFILSQHRNCSNYHNRILVAFCYSYHIVTW